MSALDHREPTVHHARGTSLLERWGTLALAVSVASIAQQPTAVAEDDVDEVTVTARKVAEVRDELPLAIAVVEDDGGESGVGSLQNLIARVPGLYYESTWGGLFSTPSLRGQQASRTGEVNVGVFVDGVYQANATTLAGAPIDVERIEIVRGPQSALFGHSTFAGAVHYVGRAPTATAESGFAADFGSDEYGAASGYVSGPMRSGSVLGRVALGWESFAGGYPNVAAPSGKLGGSERRSLAATLAVPGTANFAVRWSARFGKARFVQPPAAALAYGAYNCGAIEQLSGLWSYFCGELPTAGELAASPGIPDSENENAQMALQLSWSRPGGVLETQTGVYRGVGDSYRDFDVSSGGQTFGVCTVGGNCSGPVGVPRFVNRLVQVDQVSRHKSHVEEWTQEVRWRSVGNARLHWSVGASIWRTDERTENLSGFERVDLAESERLTALLPLTPAIVGPLSIGNAALVPDPNLMQATQALAFGERRVALYFGTFDYGLAERLEARFEVGATHERRVLDSRFMNFAPASGVAIAPHEFHDVTPRASLELRATEAAKLYFSIAKGSQSGGINPFAGLAPEEQTYDAEYNWTHEIGGRYRRPGLSLDGAVYYVDWRDAQLLGFAATPAVPNLITLNTSGLRVRGIELSLAAEPAEFIRTELGFSYADPEFRQGSDDPGSRRSCGLSDTNATSTFCTIGPAREAGTGLVPYIDGNVPGRTPRRTWHAAVAFAPELRGPGRLMLRVDAGGQDDVYDRAIEGAKFGARVIFDARISYDLGSWSFALWGRNLGETEYVRALSSRGQLYFPTTPRPLDMIYGDPRRVGLTVSFASASRAHP